MRHEVTIVDYGRSNLLSVQRALEACGACVRVAHTPEALQSAQALVLPGVGAFADGMAALRRLGLAQPLVEQAARGVPLLGICLGMQMLFGTGEEGGRTDGLGLLAGSVAPLPGRAASGEPLKTPHIGWSALLPSAYAPDALRAALAEDDEVYFVHGYQALPGEARERIADIQYGGHAVCAAVRRDNICGLQFHPEKSGRTGLAILRAALASFA